MRLSHMKRTHQSWFNFSSGKNTESDALVTEQNYTEKLQFKASTFMKIFIAS